ncbi:MAG: hypothetical protein LBK65_02700 [Tannerellaceae bacterium]|jgi:hypothetical protein|nr:hypothetical protein [Tannerellaceae bacterium]
MKRIRFLIAALIVSAGMLAPQGLSAQQRVIKAQGHPHELLTRKAASGEWRAPLLKPAITGSTTNVNFGDIEIWAHEAINPDWDIDSAALIVKWTTDEGLDNILIWGYRWNSYTVFESETIQVVKHGIDMMRAVASTDPRFIVLMQNTGSMGYTIDGIGYEYAECRRPLISFDFDDAKTDSHIAFHYCPPPNYDMGQKTCPDSPRVEAAAAIKQGILTGIIEHPFNIVYGYPAYDYDWWTSEEDDREANWQAGWYTKGYWSYWVKDTPNGNFGYSGEGISSHVIDNGYVDGWVFDLEFGSYDMSGDYVAAELCP